MHFFLTIQQFLILLLRGQFCVKFRWISSELGQQQTQEVTYKHPKFWILLSKYHNK